MRTGVLGGTFDPVHYGHLLLAEGAANAAALDRVLFMPAHIQPFKRGGRVTDGADRTEMLRRALSGNGKFALTDIELSRGGVSYTIDSLRRLRDGGAPGERGSAAGGEDEYLLILGADMFLSLEKWREHESLLREFACVVGRRPGRVESETEAAARRYREEYGAGIVRADNTWMDVSSTEIRRRVAAGESIRYLTPDAVIGYIEERGLYGQD